MTETSRTYRLKASPAKSSPKPISGENPAIYEYRPCRIPYPANFEQWPAAMQRRFKNSIGGKEIRERVG